MTYNASDAEAKDLGFTLPAGTDLIRSGDDVIKANAKVATGAIRSAFNRLTALETKPAPIADHGGLTGLGDDDHPQYLNTARGDGRYAPLTHTHAVTAVTGLQGALDGKALKNAVQPAGEWTVLNANTLTTAGRFLLLAGASQNVPTGGLASVGVLDVIPRVPEGTNSVYQRWTVHNAQGGTSEWVRSSLDGGTSWRRWDAVTLQDTGWRVISSWTAEGVVTGAALPAGVTPYPGRAGHIRYRREGTRVTLSLKGANAVTSAQVVIPSGFAPAAGDFPMVSAHGSSHLIGANSAFLGVLPTPSNAVYSVEVEWPTRIAWPTTLPGTPG